MSSFYSKTYVHILLLKEISLILNLKNFNCWLAANNSSTLFSMQLAWRDLTRKHPVIATRKCEGETKGKPRSVIKINDIFTKHFIHVLTLVFFLLC